MGLPHRGESGLVPGVAMKRILYLYRDSPFARFIQDDRAILATRYQVDDVHMQGDLQTFRRLLVAAARADLVYFWWGDLTGTSGLALAQLFRKPSVMITGGYDVADVPAIRYGLRYHPWRKYLPQLNLHFATAIIANAEFSRAQVLRDFGVPPEKVHFIPHGLDPNAITAGDAKKERRVLTCSLVTEEYIPYKGLDTFVRAAASLPDVPFIHTGPHKEPKAIARLKAMAPPNVEFRGFLSEAELIEEMRRATVYCQLSAHEGFGLALAEAMLAGATPVVTQEAAIPEVAGPVAEYVRYGDPQGTAEAIRRALAAPRGEAARSRIVHEFPLTRRAQGILQVVERCLA